MTTQQHCLRWNDHHTNFISAFSSLLTCEALVDVTLAAEDNYLQAHKVVLSACSSYFQTLFTVNPCKHPIVILKDVQFADLKIIVDFMYNGEINVTEEQLPYILKTAELLKIKGLSEIVVDQSISKPAKTVDKPELVTPNDLEVCSKRRQATLSPSRRRKRLRKSSTGSASSTDSPDLLSIEPQLLLGSSIEGNVMKVEPDIFSSQGNCTFDAVLDESHGSIKEEYTDQMTLEDRKINFSTSMDIARTSEEELPEPIVSEGEIPSTRKLQIRGLTPFNDYDDLEFFERFRLTKSTTFALLQQIEEPLKSAMTNEEKTSPIVQLLMTLRYYATGNLLIASGDFRYIFEHEVCVLDIVNRVSKAIRDLHPKYIQMYGSDPEMKNMADQFYKLAGFPGVIGAIDCTLIPIQPPDGNDKIAFQCGNGSYALKVQTVTDANLKFRVFNARWPGSADDQSIFNNSQLKVNLEEHTYGKYLLVGNDAFTMKSYLMTKLPKVYTRGARLYNNSINLTRKVADQQYVVWKKRFPILSTGFQIPLDQTINIILATAVLHNVAIDMSEKFPNGWLANDEDEENDIDVKVLREGRLGGEVIDNSKTVTRANLRRQMIVNQHFAKL